MLKNSSSSGLYHHAGALTWLHIMIAWTLLAPPLHLSDWISLLALPAHWVEFPNSCGRCSLNWWSPQSESELTSQRRSHSPAPDSVLSTVSFSPGTLVWDLKISYLKSCLGDHSDSWKFSETWLWEFPCKKSIPVALKLCLFYDGDELSWFCQPTSPFCTFLLSIGEFEFKGKFCIWSILRHPVIIVQQAWIVFKIAN